jgi:hypothetical protein
MVDEAGVGASSAVNQVAAMPVSGVECVDAPLTVEAVETGAATDLVLARATPGHVVSVAATYVIATATTAKDVHEGVAHDQISGG